MSRWNAIDRLRRAARRRLTLAAGCKGPGERTSREDYWHRLQAAALLPLLYGDFHGTESILQQGLDLLDSYYGE